MGVVNQGVVLPVLLEEDVRQLVAEPLQASRVGLVRDVLESSGGCIEVAEEGGEVEAKEGIHLFGAPTETDREPWLAGLIG